jgi:RNA polymerase sigma-70 factor (ECF subfamily)
VSTVCVTDAELVARARQGDPAAFGELVDRHRSAVYRAALSALGSPADAEDAAQDAFVAAYQRLSSFRGEASFKTWLLTIAWHQAINRRRTLMRWWRLIARPQRDDDDAGPYGTDGIDVSGGDPSPEKLLGSARLQKEIKRAIDALPPKLRDCLLLAASGEYKYEEIAAMLKAPVGTVKWRVSEARRVVKERLRERGYDDVA